jgi:putative DNA primase/helicase
MPSDSEDLEHLSDLGNAKRLISLHGEKLRHITEWGWMVYDGQRWVRDMRGLAERMAKDTVGSIHWEAGQIEDEEKRKPVESWAFKSEDNARIKAMLNLAMTEEGVGVGPEAFDSQPFLFNVLNGTLDLCTGQLRPHNPCDMLSKIAPVKYDEKAECPTWLKFLTKIMDNNLKLVGFIQRALGYSLTGSIREQCLFFMYGTGQNGKSTFLDAIQNLLGDYAKTSSAEAFLAKDIGGDGPRNDIARLVGSRFVKAVEPEKGRRWAEALIKEITGGDIISVRFLRREFFEFKPEFKLWFAANHKPKVVGQDLGIWRRIRLIPFEIQISEDEKDLELPKKLEVEFPGILAWAVQGCQDWLQNGLQPPAEVLEATEIYKKESDVLHEFIIERCFRGRADKYKTILKELYKAYVAYCTENSERPLGKQNFSESLQERGIAIGSGAGNKTTVFGLSLLTEDRIGEPKVEPDIWDYDEN